MRLGETMSYFRIEVGKIDGQPINYDPNTKKFSATMQIDGNVQTFTSVSDVGLRKKVREARGNPPMKAIWLNDYYPAKPEVVQATSVGGRFYMSNPRTGKKQRVDRDSLREYDEAQLQQLNEIFEAYEASRQKWRGLVNRMARIR